jgi:hypothetical protein
MVKPSNKWIADILTQSTSSGIWTKVNAPSPPMRNDNVDDVLLERKISLATEGFTTHKFCERLLKDRKRLSKENALTLCDYVITMKREVNPRLIRR